MSRNRDERGSILPMVAVLVTVVVLFAAFAVDLGMQRVARRDMQALADMVALDLARQLDGRPTAAYPTATLETAMTTSRRRNNGDAFIGGDPVLDYELGTLDASGVFRPVGAADVPTAVKVTASTEVDFSFAPGSGGAARQAVATADTGACFSVGSYAARLRTGDSPLLAPILALLGSDVELGVLDVSGLADAQITLLGLVDTDLGAGSTEELVALRGVRLADFYLAIARVLSRESGRTAEVQLLETLGARVGDLRLEIADILSLGTGAAAGLDATLNVFDLVATSLLAANGANALQIPDLGVNLGGLTDLDASLTVLQEPQIGCGRAHEATASSSQVELALSGKALDVDLDIAGWSLLKIFAGVETRARLAPTTATLTDVSCTPSNESITLDAQGGLLSLDLDLTLDVKLIGIDVVKAPISVWTSFPGTPASVTVPARGDFSVPGSVGVGTLGIPTFHFDSEELRVLGLRLGKPVSDLVSLLLAWIVNPVVKGLDQYLLDPLLSTLGLQVAGADLYALPSPSCGIPALRG